MEVCGGCASLFVLDYHWSLPLATINLIGDNREFQVYFDLLYQLWVVNILRILNVHHCLSLTTIDCP